MKGSRKETKTHTIRCWKGDKVKISQLSYADVMVIPGQTAETLTCMVKRNEKNDSKDKQGKDKKDIIEIEGGNIASIERRKFQWKATDLMEISLINHIF